MVLFGRRFRDCCDLGVAGLLSCCLDHRIRFYCLPQRVHRVTGCPALSLADCEMITALKGQLFGRNFPKKLSF
jgi:hypothetical protein